MSELQCLMKVIVFLAIITTACAAMADSYTSALGTASLDEKSKSKIMKAIAKGSKNMFADTYASDKDKFDTDGVSKKDAKGAWKSSDMDSCSEEVIGSKLEDLMRHAVQCTSGTNSKVTKPCVVSCDAVTTPAPTTAAGSNSTGSQESNSGATGTGDSTPAAGTAGTGSVSGQATAGTGSVSGEATAATGSVSGQATSDAGSQPTSAGSTAAATTAASG